MRGLALALLLACPCALGCFALDLIDEGQKEMERYSGGSRSSEAAEEPAEAKAADGEAPPTSAELRKQWWGQARSLAPGERKAEMVRCELAGAVRFTSPVDCHSRGGRVL